MNAKLKIALLSMLGFSTVACCGSKKAGGKKDDAQPQIIESDSINTGIILMYGVPFPDGRPASPISEEEAAKRVEEIRTNEAATEDNVEVQKKEEENEEDITIQRGPAPAPDGTLVTPITEEEAAKLIEEMESDKGKAQHGPARLPDGSAASTLSEEEAAKRVAEMEAKSEQAQK